MTESERLLGVIVGLERRVGELQRDFDGLDASDTDWRNACWREKERVAELEAALRTRTRERDEALRTLQLTQREEAE